MSNAFGYRVELTDITRNSSGAQHVGSNPTYLPKWERDTPIKRNSYYKGCLAYESSILSVLTNQAIVLKHYPHCTVPV